MIQAVFNRAATGLSVMAELTHVFCCGIPLTVAALSLGTVGGAFTSLHAFHDVMHIYEVRILLGSGLILALSGALQYLSFRLDCRQTGCHHGDCSPKKFRASLLFKLATLAYGLNLLLFMLLDHSL
jgi:hypothetical protein